MVNGEGSGVGGRSCLDSGSMGESGRLEPMMNLVLEFRLSLDLCVEAGSGERVVDDFVRNDNGRKNGGGKGGSRPVSWNWLPDEACRRSEGKRSVCGCKYWYEFR